MVSFFRSPTQAETTLVCPECNKNLNIMRDCFNTYMKCHECRKKFAIEAFIPKMDKAMEDFLENIYVDRV